MSVHSRLASLLRRSSYSLIRRETYSHHIGEIAPSQEEKHIERRHPTYNYPWPEAPSAKQRAAVEAAAQAVLDARKKFPEATLADLYDPLSMPPALVKAHAALDRAVDLCYRPQAFDNDHQRVEHLFALYEQLTAPLVPTGKKKRSRPRSN